MFRIGQKVVCVDVSPFKFDGTLPPLRKGAVYTVTGHVQGILITLAEQPGVRTDGVMDPKTGFLPMRFRPVQEKSTDAGMAILKEILDRETVKEPAPTSYQLQLSSYRNLPDILKNR